MPDAKLADGTILRFPEGTAPEVIDRAVKAHMAQPRPSAYPSRISSAAPTGGNDPGGILPLNKDAYGNTVFDPNAGLLGMLLSGATAPGDALTGKLQVRDPETGGISQEAVNRSLNLSTLATPLPAATRAGQAVMGGKMALNPAKAPTQAQVKGAAKEGYKALREMDIDYSATAVADLARGIQRDLEQAGFRDHLTPDTFKTLKGLQDVPEGAVASVADLVAAREALAKGGQNFTNPREREAARRAVEVFDDWLGGSSQAAVRPAPSQAVVGQGQLPVAGLPEAGAGPTAAQARNVAQTFRDARGNYAAAKRAERIDNAEYRAELRSAAANSGHNTGNSLRQNLASTLIKDKDRRGFSKEEIAAIEKAVKGRFGQNAARHVGNLLGGGGGLGQVVPGGIGAGIGALATGGSPVGAAVGGAIPPLLGSILRGAYNRSVGKDVAKLEEKILKRSPLYGKMKGDPKLSKSQEAAVKSLLLYLGLEPQQ